jgi:hypothetical protein
MDFIHIFLNKNLRILLIKNPEHKNVYIFKSQARLPLKKKKKNS